MDVQRGRSPSQGANIRHSPSPSPHPPFNSNLPGSGLHPSSSLTPPDLPFHNPTTTSLDLNQQQYLTASASQQQHLNPQGSNNLFALGGGNNAGFDTTSTIDPAFLNAPGNNDSSFLDPQLIEPSFGSATLLNDMATAQAHSPTPPHLRRPDMHRAHSASPHHSPNMSQGAFPSPGPSPHSRHASLDPSSAAFPQGNEWAGIQFRGHRRSPSDAYSDVSSSAHPSPYLGNTEDYDPNGNPSPLLSAQQDPALYSEVMNFGQFSLNESGSRHVSPAHSPHISPRLLPQQQSLPQFGADGNFGLSAPMGQYNGQQGLGVYPGAPQESFPPLGHNSSGDFGHADQMSPPEINIDFAPPSRQTSFDPPKPGSSGDALSPPDRSRSRNRMRAKSDSSLATPSRESTPALDPNSLSPNAAKSSRSPSPSSKSSRRSSTSSIPHRDYILDLADPSRPSVNIGGPDVNNGSKRTQKHPATFQCTLCPKRFTRAYNLRSHLRTHTDERPFVCTVCGKAFARQHDRKRHEGLHSGEKKFVCRGILKDANNWGCGRRFARADALGRHFRSEAGRVCIRPLLEEEAQEKGWEAQQAAMNNGNGMMPHPMQQPMGGMAMHSPFEGYPAVTGEGMPPGALAAPVPYALPAALLQQYPALAGIQWDSLPPGPPPDEMEGDISGRSSFDASSGGEYYDDEGDDFGQPQQGHQYGYMEQFEAR